MAKKLLCAGVGKLNSRVAANWLQQSGSVIGLRRSQMDETLPFEQRTVDLASEPWPDVGADVIVVALSAAERTPEAYRQAYVAPIQQLAQSLSTWQRLPEKVIAVSSTRVYGSENGELITDDLEAQTDDEFGRILLAMEAEVTALPVPASVVRLSGIYGPGRDWLKRSALQATEESVTQNKWTNRIHIDDAAAAIVFLLHQRALADHYIVSDLQPVSLLDMYDFFRKREGVAPLAISLPVSAGKRLLPTRLQGLGFTWQYPNAFSGGYD